MVFHSNFQIIMEFYLKINERYNIIIKIFNKPLKVLIFPLKISLKNVLYI
jgi:hypothetical protein